MRQREKEVGKKVDAMFNQRATANTVVRRRGKEVDASKRRCEKEREMPQQTPL